MHYTKEDARYIIGTFVVLFISMILNFSLNVNLGDVNVGIGIGIIFGSIFTMIRLKKYLQSKKVMALFILLTLCSLSFLIPLCVYPLIARIEPQLGFIGSLLLQTEFTPNDFNAMVGSIRNIQGDLLLVTSLQAVAMILPNALTLVAIGSILEEVGQSCSLNATKKVKKNYIIAAITSCLIIVFSVIVMSFGFKIISLLEMLEDGTMNITNEDEIVKIVSGVGTVSFLLIVASIVYIVFFIRGFVIMNKATKEIESFNPHQNNFDDYPGDENQNNE